MLVRALVIGRRRRVGFSTWLAFRSTFMAVMAIVAAVILNQTALPKLALELGSPQVNLPGGLERLLARPAVLPYLPVPGLVLGIGALVLRPLRPILAVLSAGASLIAFLLIVGTLIVSMLPLYHVPKDLSLGG
jgi:hypothetical protein